MSQFISFGPGGQNVTMGSQALSWDGGANLTAYGAITGTAGQLTIVRPAGWTHSGWCLIHQTQGTGAGQWEINWVDFNAQTTLYPLAYTYGTGAQVVTLSNSQLAYNNLTINGAVTTPAWNGTTGGIAAFLCRGTFTVNSSCYVSANSSGFAGGAGGVNAANGKRGAGTAAAEGTDAQTANTNGAGGGLYGSDARWGGGGGGGGGGAAGSAGSTNPNNTNGAAGAAVGAANLTSLNLGGGGGGGGGGIGGKTGTGGAGSRGGGIIVVIANAISISGNLYANGLVGANIASGLRGGGGGGGGGGNILLKARSAVLGTNLVTVAAGGGGTGESGGESTTSGGAGGAGRIHIDYYSGYTGTTTPTIDAAQDLTLKSQVYTSMV